MPYPTRPRQEDVNADSRSTAPVAPTVAAPAAPQAPSTRGGAPRLNSLAHNWAGASKGGGPGYSLPTPSVMKLPDAQKQLGDLQAQVKAVFDERLKALSEQEAGGSRFWRMYRDMPEAAAALVARRIWTNQMVASGNVADWMKWLERK